MSGGCWWVYLLDCDGRLYTGISTDPERRLEEHRNGGVRGARFTRGARRLVLRYCVSIGTRGQAQAVEYRLKRLPRRSKLAIINQAPSAGELLRRLSIVDIELSGKAPD